MTSEKFLISDIEPEILREDFQPSRLDIKIVKEERRKDLLHEVTHILAVFILICFLIILLYQIIWRPNQIIIPDYFISIVSVIIGFYFGRALPFNNHQ